MDKKLLEDFKPFFLFMSGHSQTIFGSLLSFELPLRSKTQYVSLPDKDIITMEVVTPKGWVESDPTLVLVHGLCGSHNSNYLKRLTKKFRKKGYKVVRVNLRGCGSGKGLAKFLYHSGSSEDVIWALKELKKLYPKSPFTLIGFSLGGNIVLKLAGELGDAVSELLVQVIAVSPPADLKECVRLIHHPDNQFYEKYFIKLMRNDIHYRHQKFQLPEVSIPVNMSIFEFDEYYMAPQIGYKSAMDYYEACSSKFLIENIRAPCQILFAEDDPIINPDVIDETKLPPCVSVMKTKHGGHLGFISNPFRKPGFRWLDHFLLKWVNEFNEKSN